MTDRPKRGYWIYTTYNWCVLCTKGDTFRERIYDRPKPKDPKERYEIIEFACNDHF